MTLLTIDNKHIQDDVKRLLNEQGTQRVTSIWIAGRGKNDATWRNMNDTLFTHRGNNYYNNTMRLLITPHYEKIPKDTNLKKKQTSITSLDYLKMLDNYSSLSFAGLF